MDITEFLTARLDEIERVAREAIADDCDQDEGFEHAFARLTGRSGSPLDFSPRFGDAAARMIATTAVPREMLADIAAKRRILKRHGGWHEHGGGVTYGPDSGTERACPDLRDLASVHSDHPDYRQEWKP